VSGRRARAEQRPALRERLARALELALRRNGTAVIEFAVVLPVLLLIVLGTADFALAMNTYNNETQLANEGARWAVVNSNPGSGSLQNYIKSQGDTGDIQQHAIVCITFPANPATGTSGQVGDPVQVTVSLAFKWLSYITNSIPSAGLQTTIVGNAVMRLEQLPTTYGAGCSS
jgi:Flp pilus assembly protein TadG